MMTIANRAPRPGRQKPHRRTLNLAVTAAVLLAAGAPVGAAFAQAPEAADAPAGADAVTTGQLIDLLVKSHVLSRAQVNTLLQQAQRNAAPPGAAPRAARVARGAAPAAPPGTVRVTYIPESTRQEIAADVKQQVMQSAQDEGWAAPNQSPDWVRRIRISGDLRLRAEAAQFNRDNYPGFENFNAINGSANGLDISQNSAAIPPFLNTTEDRRRYRLRARLDVAATVADWIDAEIRVGTGNDTSPISLNQTLGQTGDFSKYALWLDRAVIKMRPTDFLTINAGRSANPFWTTNLVYYDDLAFDGVSGQFAYPVTSGIASFVNLGAFPVFNTDFNFGSTEFVKTHSHDSYLFAAQAGGAWQIDDATKAKIGVGYFSYSNIRGSASSACLNPTSNGSCTTDYTKAPFLTFGNTLFPVRSIVHDAANPNGPEPNYFGLASGFHVLDLHGQVALTNFHPIDIVIDGDYVNNLAYDRAQILSRVPSNNRNTNDNSYTGGNSGYLVSVSVGHQVLDKLWDWNVSAAYKYLETDAVLDALTDPDFHLGGTNAKGYVLTANLGIAHNAFVSAKLLSTNQISGPTYANDVIQVDLNARF